MPNIEEQNLTEFLLEVKAKMANITTSENYEINDINQYVLKNSGKFIRSKIIYLYGSEIGVTKHKLIELASAAELIHLSTLIHDDIIDEADLRRDMPTVVKKWGIKKAILYGDFLYTKTFQGLNSFDNTAIAEVLINCAEALIEGEFNQLKIKDNCTFSMQDYFDVIEKKTAVLFSGVLKCLGIEAKLSEQQIIKLEHLGLAFGRAFQINDDLSDFEDSKITGKAEYKDLSEGKTPHVGQPHVKKAYVSGKVVSQDKKDKVYAIQFRRRKDSKRIVGHRRKVTTINIEEIKNGS